MSCKDWEKQVEFLAVAQGKDTWAAVQFRGPHVRRASLLGPQPWPGWVGELPWVGLRADLWALRSRLPTDSPQPPVVDLDLFSWAVWPEEHDHTGPGLARRCGLPWSEEAVQRAETVGRIFLAALHTASAFPKRARDELEKLLPLPIELKPPAAEGPRLPPPPPPLTTEKAFRHLQAHTVLSDRPSQRAYAQAVEEALKKGEVVLLEAGPGTGKTFGYLIPLLCFLVRNASARAAVSTRTKTLQEQLWKKDLPFLLDHLGLEVSRALLKGRENYACLRRLEQAQSRLWPAEIQVALRVWAERTTTGDLEELAGLAAFPEGKALLADLADAPLRCAGAACAQWWRCPSRRAREQARKSQLVVINHALLGAHLAREGDLLDPFSVLIVDEAHALPDALRDALTVSLFPWTIPNLLGHLRHGDTGLLVDWAQQADIGEVLALWERANAAHRRFWAAARGLLPPEPRRYGPQEIAALVPPAEESAQILEELARALQSLRTRLADAEAELARASAEEAARLAATLRFLVQPTADEFVFWFTQDPQPTLAATPLNVDEILARQLWPQLKAAVLTSATLAAGDRGETLARALGLPAARFAAWPSPFPYTGVHALLLPFLPHPDAGEFPAALAGVVRAALEAAPRRVLVLFTSKKALLATAQHLAGYPVLAQGRDGERELLLRRFRRHPPPVALLGLDSFWEGIDLPGEELEVLVLARLPFPVPSEPLAQAEAERLARQGRDPFVELALPRAVLKFRQGMGRLVRTPTDRGVIVLADARLANRSYGAKFLATLPVPAQPVEDLAALRIALARLLG